MKKDLTDKNSEFTKEFTKMLKDNNIILDGLTKMPDDNHNFDLYKADSCQIIDNIRELKNKEIISKWEKLGLLNGLEGREKEIIVMAFEELAKQLIDCPANPHHVEILSFPIVRRILTNNGNYAKFRETTIKAFISKFISDLKVNIVSLNEFGDLFGEYELNLDPEAFFCAEFSDNYELSDNYKINEN